MREAREEDGGVGDRLREVGDVLADERLREPELVREHDRVTVLAQGLGVVARRRMQRHCEVAEPQGARL